MKNSASLYLFIIFAAMVLSLNAFAEPPCKQLKDEAKKDACLNDHPFYTELNEEVAAVCKAKMSSEQDKIDCDGYAAEIQFANRTALKFCKAKIFPDDTLNCLEIIGNVYFDTPAAKVCKAVAFPNEADACFSAIANKTYTTDEIENCTRTELIWDSDKISCLRSNGKSID